MRPKAGQRRVIPPLRPYRRRPGPHDGKPAASDHLPALPDERGNGKGDLKSGFSADYKNFEEDFYEREPIGLSLCKRSAEQGPGLPEQPAAGGGVLP